MAPEVVAHRLLRRTVEHLQERMACREAQLEARADEMPDPVTKRVDMALIRYNMMEVRRQPEWRLRQSEGARDQEEQEGEEQRERLMARRRKRVRQVSEQGGTRSKEEVRWGPVGRQLVAGLLGPGGARPKGHPTLGPEYPGRGVVRATGRERLGRKADTQRWPTGLEHPGEMLCPPRTETFGAGSDDGHLGSWDQSTWRRQAPAWSPSRLGMCKRGRT